MAYPDGCRPKFFIPAEAKALPCEEASALVRAPQNTPAAELEHASVTIHCQDGRARQCHSSANCKACCAHLWGKLALHFCGKAGFLFLLENLT